MRPWDKTGNYRISVCSKCGLGITDNANLQKSNYHRDEVYLQESEQFKNIFARRVGIIRSFSPNPGRVLEIGSSTGLMLMLLKKSGWDVLGIEISSDAASFAQKQGIPTKTEPFEKVKLTAKSFDMVIINHTLEHLENPDIVLSKVNQLLRNGGFLLIDVPNFGSLSAKLLRNRWPALLPGEHLWHFTFKALSLLLNKHGFEIVSRSSPSGIWDYGNPMEEILQSLTGLKKRFLVNILTAIPAWIISLLNVGTSLTVVARKIE